MIIVSRKIVWDLPQKDGTHNVRDLCIDDIGNEYYSDYNAPNGFDVVKRMNQRVFDDAPVNNTPDEKEVLQQQVEELTAQVADLTDIIVTAGLEVPQTLESVKNGSIT